MFTEENFLVGGHRGCGENMLASISARVCSGYRENTVESLNAAAALGAHFVEFDVQVSADRQPLLFHDDYVVHNGLCAPMRSLVAQLTAAELRGLPQLFRWTKHAATRAVIPQDREWLCEREDKLPTLAQVFDEVPQAVGLNLEIKMATSSALAATPLAEVERVVQPTLLQIAARGVGRAIAISSFDPDVMAYVAQHRKQLATSCRELTLWQLTTGPPALPHADARRNSASAAAEWAQQNGFDGIVVESACIQNDSCSIQAALDQGLKVMTYGVANSDLDWVLQQQAMGVTGVITDSPGVVARGLAAVCGDSSPSSSHSTEATLHCVDDAAQCVAEVPVQ